MDHFPQNPAEHPFSFRTSGEEKNNCSACSTEPYKDRTRAWMQKSSVGCREIILIRALYPGSHLRRLHQACVCAWGHTHYTRIPGQEATGRGRAEHRVTGAWHLYKQGFSKLWGVHPGVAPSSDPWCWFLGPFSSAPTKLTMTASGAPEDSPWLQGCSRALESIKLSKMINYFTVFMASTLTCFTSRFPITYAQVLNSGGHVILNYLYSEFFRAEKALPGKSYTTKINDSETRRQSFHNQRGVGHRQEKNREVGSESKTANHFPLKGTDCPPKGRANQLVSGSQGDPCKMQSNVVGAILFFL